MSNDNNRRRDRGIRAEYEGRLAQRMHRRAFGLDAETVPAWFRGSLMAWQSFVKKAKDDDAQDFVELLTLLFDHFGIEPTEPDPMTTLVFCLAAKHVPAFSSDEQHAAPNSLYRRRLTTKGPDGLDVMDTMVILGEAAILSDEIARETGREPSTMALSKKLSAQLSRHPRFRRRRLSSSLIKKRLTEVRYAERAYRQGEANPFQQQVIDEVRPLLCQLKSIDPRAEG